MGLGLFEADAWGLKGPKNSLSTPETSINPKR